MGLYAVEDSTRNSWAETIGNLLMENMSVWVVLVFNGVYFTCLEDGAFQSKESCCNYVEDTFIRRYFTDIGKDFEDLKYTFTEGHNYNGTVLTWTDQNSGYYITACELYIIEEETNES